MLIKLVLKGGMKNDVEVVEDKTKVDETETEGEYNDSPDIVAMTIWVPGNSSFFLKMMKKLCINLSQCLLAGSAVLFSVNFTVLTASLLFLTFQHQISNL